MQALGLQDLRADEGEGVHGGGLKLAAPFPAAKACVPQGDEREKSVATATGLKVFVVYSPSALEHLGLFAFVDDDLDPSTHGLFRAFAGPICPWLLPVSVQWLQGSQQVVPVAVMSGSAAATDPDWSPLRKGGLPHKSPGVCLGFKEWSQGDSNS